MGRSSGHFDLPHLSSLVSVVGSLVGLDFICLFALDEMLIIILLDHQVGKYVGQTWQGRTGCPSTLAGGW